MIFLPRSIFAQTFTDTTARPAIIKIYPLQLIGTLGFAGIREYVGGFEQTINQKYSIELIAGIYKNDIYCTDRCEGCNYSLLPAKGIDVNIHIKKYFKKHSAPRGFHQGILLKYKYQDFGNINISYQSRVENINAYKNAGSVNYVIGKNIIFFKHLSFDLYSGLGIKFKYNVEKINYKDLIYDYYPRTIYYQNKKEVEKGFYLNFILGLSLGFVF